VGICAGAFLGSHNFLNLLPVEILDFEHWNRGQTDECEVTLSPEIRSAATQFGAPCLPDKFSVPYRNGPLLGLLENTVVPVLTFESELLGDCGTYPASMRGSSAAVAGFHENGRVVLISPHLEDSDAHRDLLRGLVHWASCRSTAVPPVPMKSGTQVRLQTGATGSSPASLSQSTEILEDSPLVVEPVLVLLAVSLAEAMTTEIRRGFKAPSIKELLPRRKDSRPRTPNKLHCRPQRSE